MFGSVEGGDWLALTAEPLPVEQALGWAGGPGFGAVVHFSGLVRDHAEGRSGVTAIEYEAYEEQVVPRLRALAGAAREDWPALGRIVLWHRVGLVRLGEASVVVVVSSPHRAEAFGACRYLIDALKASVPIWKLEHLADRVEWSPATHGLEPPRRAARERA